MGRIARVLGIWAVTLLLALISVLAGSVKFSQAAAWDRMFARWGYPGWFRPIVGAAEVVSGVLVLAPPIAAYGAATMAITMTGAVVTHLVHGEMQRLPSPSIPLALSLIVFAVRRPAWLRRQGRARDQPAAT